MKKIFGFLMAAAVLFGAASCAKEDISSSIANGEQVEVTFTANLPELGTRAIGEGEYARTLKFFVYEYQNDEVIGTYLPAVKIYTADNEEGTNVITSDSKYFNFSLSLIKGMKYNIVFWADKGTGSPYSVVEENGVPTGVISADYRDVNANDDTLDAFFGALKKFDPAAADAQARAREIKLYRPFAQLNAKTNDIAAVTASGATLTKSSLTVKTYTTLDLFSGAVGGLANVTFKPNNVLDNNGYISMNYLLAPETKCTADVTFDYEFAGRTVNYPATTYTYVPLQRNYKTNILGSLLTKSTDFNVEILPGFEEDEYDVNVWDGKTATKPAYDENTKTYTVTNGAELAWIAAAVNGTLPESRAVAADNFTGKTVKLMNDIYLENEEWTPIGNGKHFMGTFDGNGKTIYGLKVTEYNGSAPKALFGIVSGSPTIKDLTIDGATVAMNDDHTGDFYAAGLIGTFYGHLTVDGVTIKNSTMVGNNKVAGLLAHDGLCSSLSINNCHILHCNISSTNREDGGNVGGLLGLFQSSNGEFKITNSSVKQTTITGINSTNSGKRANGQFVACVSSKENQTLVITDCVVENNRFNDTIDGTTPISYVNPYNTPFIGGERNGYAIAELPGSVNIDGDEYPVKLAKVGNTVYYNIDEAVAAWTNNTTLTLLANATLNNVITLKSTEYHILDLGTYTLTAAKGKDAISITAEGRSSASYALDIKADATNPGGITATSKAVVKTTGKSGVQDRPIIRFYNGIYNASNVISHSGSNGTNCPQFWFYDGVYNCSLSANRALIQIYGGTFNGRFYISVDSSAYALISGGKFKYLDNLYGSALNSDKFTIGSTKKVFDRGVYVDDEGYIVVGGPVITEFGDKFAAKATNASKAGSYLPYSSAAANGLYYTNAQMAITKHGEANVVLK